MSWLASLDLKARSLPTVPRWCYLALRWFLILLGGYASIALAYSEVSRGRVGLGTGIAVAVVLGVIKGVLTAASSSITSSPEP